MKSYASEQALITVGIVDNNEYFTDGLSARLNQLDGINCILKAYSGDELLHFLEIMPSLPDLLLMDVAMPGINGIKTTKQVTKDYPSIKVIAMSILEDDWNLSQMMNVRACSYIRKDTPPEQLQKILHEIYRTGKNKADLYHMHGEGLRDFANSIKNVKFKENEVRYLQLLCKGYNNSQIAEEMNLSDRTIEYYWAKITKKLNTNNRAHIIYMAWGMKNSS